MTKLNKQKSTVQVGPTNTCGNCFFREGRECYLHSIEIGQFGPVCADHVYEADENASIPEAVEVAECVSNFFKSL